MPLYPGFESCTSILISLLRVQKGRAETDNVLVLVLGLDHGHGHLGAAEVGSVGVLPGFPDSVS